MYFRAGFNACRVVMVMAKLYLLGGENTIRRTAKVINHAAFADACGSPAVLVFPWARPSFDNIFARRKRLSRYFKSLGARAVDFVDYSEPKEEIAAKIAESDLIYLTGGQLVILMDRLTRKGVDDLLREYKGVIVGRSAGALALAKQGVVTNRYNRTTKITLGLGLADLCLKVHYEPVKDTVLKKLSKKQKIYAVPEGSAIVYNEGNLSFLGDIFLFNNGVKQALNYFPI